MKKSEVIVIGAGPAGMMAAIAAAQNGKKVLLLEGTSQLGKKLSITGGGRCNVTNARDISDFFDKVVRNHKFLYTPFYSFTNEMLMDFFMNEGVDLQIEEDMKVYPKSHSSKDVIEAMQRVLERSGVQVLKSAKVSDIKLKSGKAISAILENGAECFADSIIVATGGKSYPHTGSDGSMFDVIKRMGHFVQLIYPALSPLLIRESWVKGLSGISLEAHMDISHAGRMVYSNRGDLLFTHFGLSGPLALCASSYINRCFANGDVEISIDFAPDSSASDISGLIREHPNKAIWNNLKELLPVSLMKELLSYLDINDLPNNLKKVDEERIVNAIKKSKLSCSGIMDIKVATVTSGGVKTSEIDPHTMRSKLVENVLFAGEVIDVDALTGGYNLQIAFSTGYVAGINA
ncbi:hypothetical protein SAMN02745945_00478 [Peptoclostridium litorale DSM 5388]|uniref:Flavo, HI0933 family protein n=1 Tax=Peptoclostridium litorale DSM 5388 TaxID=1121324 RepID=A0A069RDQ6_PEPLI|nr:NAD(P)/FAD-dependent oxidoreductase [Peptoclostridium litorale]KDR95151.1 flavo, HI0933 family protein [Peptoclostridium litorale DSM 5388]SIN74181.1 hypothetical protein SAMN02745945_00478 [Peptoclostridium litorale DSM 5388]